MSMKNNANTLERSDIKGYEGRYQIRMIEEEPWVEIRGITKFKKNIKLQHKGNGYYKVGLYTIPLKYNNELVHRLVGKQYIENPNEYETINHVNGNKLDNRIGNLEWCTVEHNIEHAFKTGLIKSGRESTSYGGDIGVYDGNGLIKILTGKRDMENNGFCNSRVYDCANGKRKNYKGYTFKRL